MRNRLAAVAVLVVASGCAPKVGGEADDALEGKATYACFNPTEDASACSTEATDTVSCPPKFAPVLPLPNDQLTDTLPPTKQMPIVLRFSGPIKPETLAEGIRILCPLCSKTPAPGAPVFDAAKNTVTMAAPTGGWEIGKSYVVAVIGGTHASAVQDRAGKGVEPEPVMYFLRSEADLVVANRSALLLTKPAPDDPRNCKDDDGDGQIDEEVVDEETAAFLASKQTALNLVFIILKSLGFERADVALVWSFTPVS